MNKQHNLRTFYTLILTQVFSLIGSQISGFAISIWVYQQTGDATPLALVSFFFIVPQVLAAGLSGVLADRWDRRYVMMLADTGQAVGTVLLLISFASGQFQLWHLYAVTFLQSLFNIFQGPSFQASVTMLVPDEQRDRANAMQQVTNPLAGIIAPAIAGMLYPVVGVIGSIAIDLITFLVAVSVVFYIRIPRPPQTTEGQALVGSVWRSMFDGFRYLWQRQTLFWLMVFNSLINFLVGGIIVLQTPYILSRTGSETTLGILLGIVNFGALAGGIFMGVWGGTRPRIHAIMWAVILFSLFLGLAGMAQTPVTLGITFFLFMFGLPVANASAMSMLQAKVAPDVQGRVFAALTQMSMVLLPIAYLLVGPLADNVFEPAVGQAGWEWVAPLVGDGPGAGIGLMLLICGFGNAFLSFLVYLIPAIRRIEADLPDYDTQPPTDTPPDGLVMSGA
jgi:DHA3 family macrolide efflux protein-like MFS transporter